MNDKKLYRSSTNKMLGGVCAGLGDFIGLDPTVVRLIFVLLGLLGGPGILVYLIMWVIVPQDPGVLPPASS